MISKAQLQKLAELRKSGKKIGLVQGSWDLFHVGHSRYLQKAKAYCDFLVVGVDSDEKVAWRKGPKRPIIPQAERMELLAGLAAVDMVVLKEFGDPKWGLIRAVCPQVFICIKENYSASELQEIATFCKKVEVLPRQATTSTSDKIRQVLIKNPTGSTLSVPSSLLEFALKQSTDEKCPVAAATCVKGVWYWGANQPSWDLSDYDLTHRTELFYNTVEHAEVNMLKKIPSNARLKEPVYVTLLPCERCIKMLAQRGCERIVYSEDHPKRGWSKRAHQEARDLDVQLIQLPL